MDVAGFDLPMSHGVDTRDRAYLEEIVADGAFVESAAEQSLSTFRVVA
jgi:hypothetical protein